VTRHLPFAAAVGLCLVIAAPAPALAQRSVTDVLSFLLTNRSIATGDAEQDEAAAAATRDTISRFLLVELATLPTLSSSTGFIYRMDRDLGGTVVRSSESFGPAFVERSLTAGTLRTAFGAAYQEARFNKIDGRSLADGTLVATASRLTGQAQPFDVETVAIRLRTRTLTLSTNVGVTDRLDISAALPLVHLTLSGERVDTLRGTPFVQATARVDASGVGDLVVRAKYNALRRGGTGLAIGLETRLPTGAEENLFGAGDVAVKPRVIGSVEHGRVSAHSEFGYAFGGLSRELDYAGAVAVAASPRVTIIAELLGRRLESGGRITETVAAHPRLAGVETIRLTGTPEATYRALAVGGIKWNVAATWLVSASVLRPVTSTGLTTNVIPSVVVEYSFGR
jgi:outer membrane putative beta-barrel porin/alpha-amylase